MSQRIGKMKSLGCENKPLLQKRLYINFIVSSYFHACKSAELICISFKEIVLCSAGMQSKAEYLQFVLRC